MYCCEGFYHPFDPGLQPSSVSFWMRAEQTGPEVGYLRLRPTTNASEAIVTSYFTGSNLVLSGPSGATIVPFKAGQWHHVELREIDWQARTFSYFVDGVQIGDAQSLGSASSIQRIDLFSSRSMTTEPPRLFDEIVFY